MHELCQSSKFVISLNSLYSPFVKKLIQVLNHAQDMNKSPTSSKSLTDWDRLDAMQDKDIDLSDAPEITPEMFAKAVVHRGLKPTPKKQQITIRVDNDVLEWFRAQGR